jgi:hypothetical protein
LRRIIWGVGWIGRGFWIVKGKGLIKNRNLMAKDEFKNLGFEEKKEEGKKGELRWE